MKDLLKVLDEIATYGNKNPSKVLVLVGNNMPLFTWERKYLLVNRCMVLNADATFDVDKLHGRHFEVIYCLGECNGGVLTQAITRLAPEFVQIRHVIDRRRK